MDVATIRSASRLLHPEGPRHDDGRFVDLDIAALGQLVEAVVLFDEVEVPDLGHRLDVPRIAGQFGTAVQVQSVDPAVADEITEQASVASLCRYNARYFCRT